MRTKGLRVLMARAGFMSVKALADAMGVSRERVYQWVGHPTDACVSKLAKALKTSEKEVRKALDEHH